MMTSQLNSVFGLFVYGVAFASLGQCDADVPANQGNLTTRNRSSNDPPSAQPIPGTDLKTRTLYKLSMKHFPSSAITWTDQTGVLVGSHHYVQVDGDPGRASRYASGGEWYKDSLWEFIAMKSASDGSVVGYKLRNHGKPQEFMTWSTTEFVDGNEDGRNYLILDKNKNRRRSERDFLFDVFPVASGAGNSGKMYYQLKLQELPKGVVTWTQKLYGKDSHFLQVDNSEDPERMKSYERGNEWFEDTLFSFDHAEDLEDDESDLVDILD